MTKRQAIQEQKRLNGQCTHRWEIFKFEFRKDHRYCPICEAIEILCEGQWLPAEKVELPHANYLRARRKQFRSLTKLRGMNDEEVTK